MYCASYDGYIWRGEDMGKARRPPIHPNCRCTLIPYVELKDEDGNVVDVNATRPAANEDFDALAKEEYNKNAKAQGLKRRWDDLSQSTRLKYYYKAQKDYEKRTGKSAYRQVDSGTTFAEYFEKQPESFKRQWLGAKRFEAYKNGNLDIDKLLSPDLLYTQNSKTLFDININNQTEAESSTISEVLAEDTEEQAQKAKLVDDNGFPLDLSQVVDVKRAGGSTGAMYVTIDSGEKYIKKEGASPEHLQNECVADSFYKACGVNVPDFKLFDNNGAPVKLSKQLENVEPLGDWWGKATQKQKLDMTAQLRNNLAVDILLGNWDVVGMSADNILVDSSGTAWRIDNGGALSFRAQGAKKKHNDWDDGFIDDLWNMTGNGKRIGSSISSTIPQFMGNVDVLEIANEIASRDWTAALQTLPNNDRVIVEKRLAEIKQLAGRGNGFIDNTFTREYTLSILDETYKFSKDGLREACSFICDLEHNNYGWFRNNNQQVHPLHSHRSLSEYMRDRIGIDAVTYVENCNKAQGKESYDMGAPQDFDNGCACSMKILRLRSQGFDIRNYSDFKSMHDDIVLKNGVGYYLGLKSGYSTQKKHYNKIEYAFDYFKNNLNEYDNRFNQVLKYNAGLQIALENADFSGNDKSTKSVVLMRTECDEVVAPNGNRPNVGDKCIHNVGVNESHSVIHTVCVKGGNLTMVRVPYSRINGLYMMESHNGDMYLGDSENEISADTHGLNIYFIAANVRRGTPVSYYMNEFINAERNNP